MKSIKIITTDNKQIVQVLPKMMMKNMRG